MPPGVAVDAWRPPTRTASGQGPPGYIFLAEHITGLSGGQRQGEEVWTPGAFLPESSREENFLFFSRGSALPTSVLPWSPLTPRFPSLISVYNQVPIFSFLRSRPCSLSSLLIFPLCFCFKCQGHF